MRLYLVRHAEAAPGDPDELRPLTAAGRAAAKELGARLAREGTAPDAILSSPLLRARETATALGRELGVEPETDERLAPGATAELVRIAVSDRGNSVLVVGHQPDCGLVAAELSGEAPPPFPPAGLAVFEL